MEPKCKYFGKCGGCQFQDVEYSEQLESKCNRLSEILEVDSASIDVFSDCEYSYRNRMDFVFHAEGLGFRKKGNWKEIVDIDSCVISEDRLNELLAEVRNYFKGCDYFDIITQEGTFKYCVIRVGETCSVSFSLNKDSPKLDECVELVRQFSAECSSDVVSVCYVKKKQDVSSNSLDYEIISGPGYLTNKFGDKELRYSVQGFFQNNIFVAQKLHDYVHNLLKVDDSLSNHLLDLYGGVGSFGIYNSECFRSTVTVEAVSSCVDAAKLNGELNGVLRYSAVFADAKKIREMKFGKPLTIITDPPRAGMHLKVCNWLNECGAERIVYVSCNPKTQAEDLKKLVNYSVESVALFDLFPQTGHMESVCDLRLKKD